jgi:ABC-2 type transport system ATP-binding protein|tara:strand:+ start:1679 stop:2557 length:879 start_codon:yes stop_codon:yes gene_type:complete
MSSILTFENVSKNYGKLNALSNIQFEIPENSIFAILGPNGSGKSTLIRILAGLITSWNGNIFYKDNSIHNDKNYLKNFGFIVEDPSFYQYLSAIKNLQIFCRLTNTPFSRINEVLDLVDLLDRKYDKVSNYSYGMKQRLGIAQALLHDPKILILDEPNNGLDPIGVNQIADIIYKLNHDGKTICISTHSLTEVDRLCSDVAILKEGKLIINKNIKTELKRKNFFRIEISDLSKAIKVIKKIKGVSIISKQSNSIIVSQNAKNISLTENKNLKKFEYIQSVHTESNLIEHYYV